MQGIWLLQNNRAEFELISDAGHLAFAEQPDEFYNVIKNFLDN